MVLTNNKQLTYNKHIFLGFNHFNLFNVSQLCTLVFPFFRVHDMWLYHLFANVNLFYFPPKKKEVCSCFLKMKETIWRENVANVETVKI